MSEVVGLVGLVLIACRGAVVMVAGMACSEVPFTVGWEGRGLFADGTGPADELETEVLVSVPVPRPLSPPGVTSFGPGTSRLCLRGLRSVAVTTGLLLLLFVWIGNRVSGPPVERSRRWLRLPGVGCGLLARLREAMARLRASMLARRLLSSVLMARGRPAPEDV